MRKKQKNHIAWDIYEKVGKKHGISAGKVKYEIDTVIEFANNHSQFHITLEEIVDFVIRGTVQEKSMCENLT